MKECANCGGLISEIDAVCKYCSHAPELADNQRPLYEQPPQEQEQPSEQPLPPTQPPQPDWQPPTQQTAQYAQQPQPYPQQQPQPYAQQPPPYAQQPQQYAQQPPPYAQQPQQYAQQPPPYGQQPQQYAQQPPYGQPPQYGQQQYYPEWPGGYRQVDRILCGIMAIIFGSLGIHKFMTGRIAAGVIHILFSWTGVPAIIGVVEGIIYLCMDDYSFREKYCRLK